MLRVLSIAALLAVAPWATWANTPANSLPVAPSVNSSDTVLLPTSGAVGHTAQATVTSVVGAVGMLKTNNLADCPSPATCLANIGGAGLVSPHFTGTPQAVTQGAGDNSSDIATDAFARALVNGGYSASPVSGATVSPPVGVRYERLTPAGTLATLTQALPPSPITDDYFCLMSTAAVTTITFTGAAVNDAPAYLNAYWRECFKFNGASWDRDSDIGIPSPANLAALQNGVGQLGADVAAGTAAVATMQSIQSAVDALVAGINQIGQATPTVAGVVQSTPNLTCVNTDANANIIACPGGIVSFYRVVATTGGSDTMPNPTPNGGGVFLDPGIGVTSWTETLPPNPNDADLAVIDCGRPITTLTINANTSINAGQLIRGAGASWATTCGYSATPPGHAFRYNAGQGVWIVER